MPRITHIWAEDFDNSPREGKRANQTVAWLRFIHRYVDSMGPSNVFGSNDPESTLVIRGKWNTSDGRSAFCEEYSKAGEVRFRVFIENDERWARIEAYNPNEFDALDQIANEVQGEEVK